MFANRLFGAGLAAAQREQQAGGGCEKTFVAAVAPTAGFVLGVGRSDRGRGGRASAAGAAAASPAPAGAAAARATRATVSARTTVSARAARATVSTEATAHGEAAAGSPCAAADLCEGDRARQYRCDEKSSHPPNTTRSPTGFQFQDENSVSTFLPHGAGARPRAAPRAGTARLPGHSDSLHPTGASGRRSRRRSPAGSP